MKFGWRGWVNKALNPLLCYRLCRIIFKTQAAGFTHYSRLIIRQKGTLYKRLNSELLQHVCRHARTCSGHLRKCHPPSAPHGISTQTLGSLKKFKWLVALWKNRLLQNAACLKESGFRWKPASPRISWYTIHIWNKLLYSPACIKQSPTRSRCNTGGRQYSCC